MKKIIFFLTIFPLLSFSNTTCLGPEDATFSMAYLHGMDTLKPGKKETENRKVIEKIAKELKIGFALPRANQPCPSNEKLLCWGWGTNMDLVASSVIKRVSEAVKVCYPKARPLSILGFSNGGYIVNRALTQCFQNTTPFKFFITVAADGNTGPRTSLEGCGNLTILAGKKDYIVGSIRDFSKNLKNLGAEITIIEHEGGHLVPEKELLDILRKQIQSFR